MEVAIFTPIADFDAGLGGLQLHIITWSKVIGEKMTRKKLVVGRLRDSFCAPAILNV